jgi:hypothetical protein
MMTSKTFTLEEIKQVAPSVFTTEKAAHLTDKYIQTPTSRVVEDLMRLGWQVTKAQEVKSRKYKDSKNTLLYSDTQTSKLRVKMVMMRFHKYYLPIHMMVKQHLTLE